MQVRLADQSRYHHALTVSSLGNDCQARVAPWLPTHIVTCDFYFAQLQLLVIEVDTHTHTHAPRSMCMHIMARPSEHVHVRTYVCAHCSTCVRVHIGVLFVFTISFTEVAHLPCAHMFARAHTYVYDYDDVYLCPYANIPASAVCLKTFTEVNVCTHVSDACAQEAADVVCCRESARIRHAS